MDLPGAIRNQDVGDQEILDLIEKATDQELREPNEQGATPLMLAMLWGHIGAIKALLGRDPSLLTEKVYRHYQEYCSGDRAINEALGECLTLAGFKYGN